MKFFLDTADKAEVKEASDLGLLDGVTTNPSLVAKTGKPYAALVKELCELCSGPISAEVLSDDYDGMLKEARSWHQLASNIVVKIPLTAEGLKVVNVCTQEGIETNVTLCFSALQGLAAAKVGATYISPFVGRLDDIGHVGMDLIKDIKTIYDHYNYPTQILVASIRSPQHIHQAALYGAHVATIPMKVYQQILSHPLTSQGLEKFMEDSKKIPGV